MADKQLNQLPEAFTVVSGDKLLIKDNSNIDRQVEFSNLAQSVSDILLGALSTTSADGDIELIAHRGFADIGFENTTLSLSQAKKLGATSLEFDVAISSDGEFYLFHDTTLDALTNGTGNFIDATAATINGLRYDKGVGTAYHPLRISKLDDALAVVKEQGVEAYIEMKSFRNDDTDVVAFMDKINSFGLISKVIVQSSSTTRLLAARAAYSDCRLALSVNSANHSQNVINAQNATASIVINSYTHFTTESDANTYKDAGLGIVVYTVERAHLFKSLAAIGIRRIMSDRRTF